MNPDLSRAVTVGTTAAAGQPVRPATPADAEGIVRLRSAYILSEPLSEEWVRRCVGELAPRLTPAGDARAYVIDAPDGRASRRPVPHGRLVLLLFAVRVSCRRDGSQLPALKVRCRVPDAAFPARLRWKVA